jgi:hypothetical protein
MVQAPGGIVLSHDVPREGVAAPQPTFRVTFKPGPYHAYCDDTKDGAYLVRRLVAEPARVVVLELAPRLAALAPGSLDSALSSEREMNGGFLRASAEEAASLPRDYTPTWQRFTSVPPVPCVLAADTASPFCNVLRVTVGADLKAGALYALALLHLKVVEAGGYYFVCDDFLVPFRPSPTKGSSRAHHVFILFHSGMISAKDPMMAVYDDEEPEKPKDKYLAGVCFLKFKK